MIIFVASENSPSSTSDGSKEAEEKPFTPPTSEKCRKTLRLTSEQIVSAKSIYDVITLFILTSKSKIVFILFSRPV